MSGPNTDDEKGDDTAEADTRLIPARTKATMALTHVRRNRLSAVLFEIMLPLPKTVSFPDVNKVLWKSPVLSASLRPKFLDAKGYLKVSLPIAWSPNCLYQPCIPAKDQTRIWLAEKLGYAPGNCVLGVEQLTTICKTIIMMWCHREATTRHDTGTDTLPGFRWSGVSRFFSSDYFQFLPVVWSRRVLRSRRRRVSESSQSSPCILSRVLNKQTPRMQEHRSTDTKIRFEWF